MIDFTLSEKRKSCSKHIRLFNCRYLSDKIFFIVAPLTNSEKVEMFSQLRFCDNKFCGKRDNDYENSEHLLNLGESLAGCGKYGTMQ